MIELFEMTEFVHDDVVDEVVGQLTDARIEIQVLFPRTAPPPRFHFFNLDVIKIAPVVAVVYIDTMLEEAEKVVVGSFDC